MKCVSNLSKAFVKGLFCILIMLICLSFHPSINTKFATLPPDHGVSLSLTPHEPISIISDSDFGPSKYNYSGSGTAEDPYVIEGYSITTTSLIGINIAGTTKYFIIRNCYIDASDYGIYISDVSDGTATVSNNTCYYSGRGIWLSYSDSSTVNNNTCKFNDEDGITLDYSDKSLVANNTCNCNGDYGIHLSRSENSIVTNNLCRSNMWSISIGVSHNSTVTYNRCYNNFVGLSFGNSRSCTAANNSCNNNGIGISVKLSSSCIISNNTCISNADYDGITLTSSDYCFLTNNLLKDNRGEGIYLSTDSDFNIIHHNVFVHNRVTPQATDWGFNNIWFEFAALEGNYWDDWSGTLEYSIGGGADSSDPYPLGVPSVYYGAPLIESVLHSPLSPTEKDNVRIESVVTSFYGMQSVALHYRINDLFWRVLNMTLDYDDVYSLKIGSFPINATIEYYVSAVGNSIYHNITINDNSSLFYSFTIRAYISDPQISTYLIPWFTVSFLFFVLVVVKRRRK